MAACQYLQEYTPRIFLWGRIGDRPCVGNFLTEVTGAVLQVVYERIVGLGSRQQNQMFLESKCSSVLMAEFFTVAFDICNAPYLQQMADDIMAVVHLHIDSAIRDGTGTYAGVQFASVFHAQQIYLVTATNDYREHRPSRLGKHKRACHYLRV